MNLIYLLLIFTSVLNTPLQAARILSIFGFPGSTQYEFIEPLLKELAGRGHHITSITNFPQKDRIHNFRDIVVEENVHLFDGFKDFNVVNNYGNYFEFIDLIYNKAFQMCFNILDNPNVRKILETEKFDLIILEVFLSESLFGLSEYLQAPIVGVSTVGSMINIDELVGNISPLSYIPHMTLPFRKMQFWQRFLNILIHFVEWMHYYSIFMPIQQQIYERYFPLAQLSFREAQRNFALVLVNDHFTLMNPRPYVPNMIEVAGLHINTNAILTDANLKVVLDSAKEGFIFIATTTIISPEKLKIFLETLENLPQIILWKTPQDMPNIPSNILINSNYSQSVILKHSNIKLFITTGGFLSIIESIYHGIPILGLTPMDSVDSCFDYIKKIGIGVSLNVHKITKESLRKALTDVLSSTYIDIARELSKRFRDQQTTPMERAIYWIEYVIRHNGATHLRNKGRNLVWYEFYNIDILCFIFFIIFLFTLLAYLIIKIIMKLFSRIALGKNFKRKAKEQ